MHERRRSYVAVRTGKRAAVDVAGAAGERERAVDDPDRGFADERLRRLRLAEEDDQIGATAVGEVLVDQRGCSGEDGAAGGEIDRVLGGEHPRAPVGLAAVAADLRDDACMCVLGDSEGGGGMEEPGFEVALEVPGRASGREAAAKSACRQVYVLEGHGVAA